MAYNPYSSEGVSCLSWEKIKHCNPFFHGMNEEQIAWAWIKSELLVPKQLLFKPENLYYEIIKEMIKKHEKEIFLTDEIVKE